MPSPAQISDQQANPVRRLVFISHANPENNDFARWLGAQLGNAGYEVWSDVIKLLGGELFWDDIEDAIRNHSAKFVVAVSEAANGKPGVLDEVAVAIGVERGQRIKNFVIPVRLDGLKFSDFRANLTRKNAIDFSAGWASGLDQLLKVLDRDQTPKGAVGAADVRRWCEARFDPSQQIVHASEQLISNWLAIEELPQEIALYSLGVEEKKVRGIMESCRLPWFPYFRLVGTFGTEADLRADLDPTLDIELKYRVRTDVFLRGKPPELPGMTAHVARNHLASLVRQAWDRTLSDRGLSSFEMADAAPSWFFTKGQIENDRSYFVDLDGKRRRKQVVGRSEVRSVYWHLGYRAKPIIKDPMRVLLRAAIIFSEDGRTPIKDDGRMHRLRRGFCKSWWNDQWRDLLLAYTAWLGGGGPAIELWAGDGATIRLSGAPEIFVSPVSIADPQKKAATARAALDELDEEPPDEPINEGDEDDSLGSDDE